MIDHGLAATTGASLPLMAGHWATPPSRRIGIGPIATVAVVDEPDGSIQAAWPTLAMRVTTDVTEDEVWAFALPTDLVDTRICAIEGTASGPTPVWRRELRHDPTSGAPT